jgi:hypothetical protein
MKLSGAEFSDSKQRSILGSSISVLGYSPYILKQSTKDGKTPMSHN